MSRSSFGSNIKGNGALAGELIVGDGTWRDDSLRAFVDGSQCWLQGMSTMASVSEAGVLVTRYRHNRARRQYFLKHS
jgi:hypothetical protein